MHVKHMKYTIPGGEELISMKQSLNFPDALPMGGGALTKVESTRFSKTFLKQ